MVGGWSGCVVHGGAECTMHGKNVVRVGGTDGVGCAEEGGSDDDGGTAVGFVVRGSTVNVVHVLVPVFAPQLVPNGDLLDVVDVKSVWDAAVALVQLPDGLGKMASPSYYQI